MQVIFSKSKNGEETASVNNSFLHSSYAPSKEAERFVQGLSIAYEPEIIIITEPALSYTAPFLRLRFPKAKLGAIRYTNAFEKYNKDFDFILNYFEHSDFESYLEQIFNEEELLTIQFISWQPSSRIFQKEDSAVWSYIKNALERSKTLLVTRQYFEKKWLTNTANFLRYIQNPLKLNSKINKYTVIISSGPSLKASLEIIKENRIKLFIICLSSAISVCLSNNLIPDLCMTSDGGFWAGQHLKRLGRKNIPLAMPAEALCNKSLLKNLQILPLIYDDGISKELSEASDIQFTHAVRNGTVSGTALLFAAEHCTKNIYMCGLNLASQTGYQHLQPNELELNNSLKDNRISTKEKRLTASQFSGASLDIYKNWFSATKLLLGERKVYRVIESSDRKNSLGWICDIDSKAFSKELEKAADSENPDYFIPQKVYGTAEKAADYFNQNCESENWKRQLFPLDYVSLFHNPSNTELFEKIESEYNKLKNRIWKILNE